MNNHLPEDAEKILNLLRDGYTVKLRNLGATYFHERYEVAREFSNGPSKRIIVNKDGKVIGAQG